VEYSSFNGLNDTMFVITKRKISVSNTTVDCEWNSLGKPKVSVIKIDMEESEFQILKGALSCINN